MPEYTLPAAMVVSLLAGIFTGYRVAFLLGGLGILFSCIGNIPFRFLGWWYRASIPMWWKTGFLSQSRYSFTWD